MPSALCSFFLPSPRRFLPLPRPPRSRRAKMMIMMMFEGFEGVFVKKSPFYKKEGFEAKNPRFPVSYPALKGRASCFFHPRYRVSTGVNSPRTAGTRKEFLVLTLKAFTIPRGFGFLIKKFQKTAFGKKVKLLRQERGCRRKRQRTGKERRKRQASPYSF